MEERSTADGGSGKRELIEKVLVVDDDESWCFISKRILKNAGVGQQVLTAKNGLEAVKQLQQINANGERLPDLIFLDIKMPVMDGFEFLEEITKSSEMDLSRTKIFMCSSSLHPKDKEKANQYPISGFIIKPLTKEILEDILNLEPV